MRDQKEELYSNKSNMIIQNYAWALKEKQLKIMELLCSCYMTNYYDAEKNTITVSLADFVREAGARSRSVSGGWNYKSFETAIKNLSDTSIIGIGFNGKRRIIRLINTVEFPTLEGETNIICHMSEDFQEYMKLQDRGNTKIEFKTIYSMNSRFSIKLYNLLRSWQGKETVYFEVDYLKELLNITAKSYDNFAKFRQTVLDVAVNEINEKTTLEVSYKGLPPTKGGSRKITRVVFYIKNLKPSLPAPAGSGEPAQQNQEEGYTVNPNNKTFATELDRDNYVYQYIETICSKDIEKAMFEQIPEEVHQFELPRIRALFEIISPYIILDFNDYYEVDENDRLGSLQKAYASMDADRDTLIEDAISRFNTQEYNVRRKDIKAKAACYSYYKTALKSWLQKNMI